MKWLIILVILLIVAAIVAVRYRRQIQTAIYMYRMFRKMREMSKPPAKQKEKQIDRKNDLSDVQLVRCTGCGNWVAQTEVLKMGNKISYCSAACIEKNANRV